MGRGVGPIESWQTWVAATQEQWTVQRLVEEMLSQ
jgi:hypothetical protein